MQDIFLLLAVGLKLYLAQLVFYLSTVSIPACPFQVDTETMLYRVDSNVHLQTNED